MSMMIVDWLSNANLYATAMKTEGRNLVLIPD